MKYLARKFLVTLAYVLLVGANRKYDLGLAETEILSTGGVVATFILGESYLDGKRKS
jgi:hypothetical protein